jgi:hypothetical protein
MPLWPLCLLAFLVGMLGAAYVRNAFPRSSQLRKDRT